MTNLANFCSNCGSALPDGANYCNQCGANLSEFAGAAYEEDNTWAAMLLKTDGRLNRLRYIKRTVTMTVIQSMVLLAAGLMLTEEQSSKVPPELIYLTTFIALLSLIPGYCWGVRRLHDMDKGGFVAFCEFMCGLVLVFGNYTMAESDRPDQLAATLIGAFIYVYLAVSFGTRGVNQYGADPLGRTADGERVNWAARTLSLSFGLLLLIFLLALRRDLALQNL